MRNQRGFTVVELLVALVIIGIGLMALAETMVGSFAQLQMGGQHSTAAFLADLRIEELKATSWTSLADCLGDVACRGTDGSFADPYSGYSVVTTVEGCDVVSTCGVNDPALRQVTAQVSYQPTGGAPGNATVTTLIARR